MEVFISLKYKIRTQHLNINNPPNIIWIYAYSWFVVLNKKKIWIHTQSYDSLIANILDFSTSWFDRLKCQIFQSINKVYRSDNHRFILEILLDILLNFFKKNSCDENSNNKMFKIIIFGLIVHAMFLASIFQIYFQSPIISGLQPLQNLNDSPAER